MAFIESGQKIDKEKQYKKMKKTMENMERTKITVRIPTHIYKKFKVKLVNEGLTANQFLLDIILNYIEK